MLELGVLGVGADASQADEVALTRRDVEDREGEGGDGVGHIPNVLKPSSQLLVFRGSF